MKKLIEPFIYFLACCLIFVVLASSVQYTNARSERIYNQCLTAQSAAIDKVMKVENKEQIRIMSLPDYHCKL